MIKYIVILLLLTACQQEPVTGKTVITRVKGYIQIGDNKYKRYKSSDGHDFYGLRAPTKMHYIHYYGCKKCYR